MNDNIPELLDFNRFFLKLDQSIYNYMVLFN